MNIQFDLIYFFHCLLKSSFQPVQLFLPWVSSSQMGFSRNHQPALDIKRRTEGVMVHSNVANAVPKQTGVTANSPFYHEQPERTLETLAEKLMFSGI